MQAMNIYYRKYLLCKTKKKGEKERAEESGHQQQKVEFLLSFHQCFEPMIKNGKNVHYKCKKLYVK